MANKALLTAKEKQYDEFYTVYEYIQKEINAYLEYNPDTFRDKIILCPCDDPEWSNFTKFFVANFESLGLKKLICTSYSLKEKKKQYELYHESTLDEEKYPQYDAQKTDIKGKIFTLTSKDKPVDFEDLEWDYLEGDGDFRSEEICKIRDEADIIITNPPFSLFKEFIPWVVNADKQFLIIGQIGQATYKEIFPVIKNDKMWIGATCNSEDMVFEVPEGAVVKQSDRDKAARLGYVGNYTRQGNACWYTNLDHGRRHEPLQLMTMADNLKFTGHKDLKERGYVKYDNYDAIEAKYVNAIPSDYEGIIGVSPSFLSKYNPEQFELVGCSILDCKPIKECIPETDTYDTGGKACYLTFGTHHKRLFPRVFIRHRKDFKK